MVSSDVLEHISDVDKVFAETERVLKKGGMHIFTVPIGKGNARRRAELIDGEIVHHEEPQYHNDPYDSKGIIAFWDFGSDLTVFNRTNCQFRCSWGLMNNREE